MHTQESRQKRGTRRLLLMLLVGGGLALGHGAVAWAGFFDGCIPLEPVGVITVTQHTTVKNETVTLLGDAVRVCVITVADGVTLEFKNVRVTATGPTRLRFVGGINSRLLIRGSTFTTCDNDVLGGFGAGMLIDHSVLQDPVEGAGNCDLTEIGPHGNLEIRSSTLRTLGTRGTINLYSDTTITITKSTLQAALGITIGVGLPSPLHTLVEKTEITTGGSLEIRADQDTTVLKNDFDADSITITGDPCTSASNTPDVPCS